jgi:putative ABC transport system substrate-binding protein
MVKRYKYPLVIFITSFFFLMVQVSLASEKNIGVIMTGDISYYKEVHKAFIDTLNASGFGHEKVNIILQTPAPSVVPWSNAARKLIAYDVDIIVTYGTPATVAVLNEKPDKPLVFAGVYDPEVLEIKGKKVTGISSKVPVVTAIKYLRGIQPFTKLGVIYNDSERDTIKQVNELRELEGQFGYQTIKFNVKKPEDALKISGIEALFITTSCVARQCSYNVSTILRKEKIPAASIMDTGGESGAILMITPDPEEQGRMAAQMVIRILKGETPSSIPIERPRKIEMIINLKEASILGIKVPLDIITSATRVIK